MTIDTTRETITDEPADAPVAELPDETVEQPEERDDSLSPNHEAAKYRRQLREAEAERDELKDALSRIRRQLIDDRLKVGVKLNEDDKPVQLNHPSDLFDLGKVDINDLFDGGQVNEEKFVQVVADLHGVRADLFTEPKPEVFPRPKPDRSQGSKGLDYRVASFADSFSPR